MLHEKIIKFYKSFILFSLISLMDHILCKIIKSMCIEQSVKLVISKKNRCSQMWSQIIIEIEKGQTAGVAYFSGQLATMFFN